MYFHSPSSSNADPYAIVHMGGDEWCFKESASLCGATERFNEILDADGGRQGLTVALRKFLNRWPNHMDALHHYATCKMDEGKPLDAFAFSQAAVAVGRAALTDEFRAARGRLPRGYFENRPFLRALYGLCRIQHHFGFRREAIATAREVLHLDPTDGMGIRMLLPSILLGAGMTAQALEFFDAPEFRGTFHAVEYLHALALLRAGRPDEARRSLEECVARLPLVAHFLIHYLPRPASSGRAGIVVGSPEEGWECAGEQRWLWVRTPGALEMLAQVLARQSGSAN
jgi:tetratricopeptide (TPR) repeat protein